MFSPCLGPGSAAALCDGGGVGGQVRPSRLPAGGIICQATLDKRVLIASSNLTFVNLRSAGESLCSGCKTVAAACRPFKRDVAFTDEVRDLQRLYKLYLSYVISLAVQAETVPCSCCMLFLL